MYLHGKIYCRAYLLAFPAFYEKNLTVPQKLISKIKSETKTRPLLHLVENHSRIIGEELEKVTSTLKSDALPNLFAQGSFCLVI